MFMLLLNVAGATEPSFLQENSRFYTKESSVQNICFFQQNIYAGAANGFFHLKDSTWFPIKAFENKTILDAAAGDQYLQVLYLAQDELYIGLVQDDALMHSEKLNAKKYAKPRLHTAGYLSTSNAIYELQASEKKLKFKRLVSVNFQVNDIVKALDNSLWIAADVGLFKLYPGQKTVMPVYPKQDEHGWALSNVRGVTIDAAGCLWFASSQGVGCFDGATWQLFTGSDGLPYNAFTCIDAGGDGAVWFGTDKGAVRFDGAHWAYRQGGRWLPDDFVNDLAVENNGTAWFATSKGIGVIERLPMTLAKKAEFYENEIDRYHRRTEYEYVLEVSLKNPGDKSVTIQHDSDNDGLWTSMYGAGECYAYAATKAPLAKKRADKVFEALEFLGRVTQGGSHPAPMGFIARTILPTDGPDPNEGRIERDIETKRERDKLWKVITPRWPKSEDGKWYWKSDTSSDELDGHYYFYGLYYDLVAETRAEKTRVRHHVALLTDHLIEHDFQLVDHDGLPTRWARFNPYELNHDRNWVFDRNLNSLSMLSYLLTAAHITDDPKYVKYAEYLVENHGYLQNAQIPKTQRGIATGNQSDDEMALMMLYNFIKYSPHQEWTNRLALACWTYGRLELPEMNPLFNYIYAAACQGQSFEDAWGTYPLDPVGPWQEDALETLQRFPLDRIDWQHDNSRRIDLLPIDELQRHFDEGSYAGRARRVNGKVIPVDERHFNHWNHDPYRLISGGAGSSLADGAVFLLPYYMGLYYGFVQ
jgi:hypothetical protein